MLILFLHGWESIPGGIKPTYLKDHGHAVLNPKLPDDDFDAAVKIAQAEFDWHRPDVVVGSSRGGAVAMNLKSGVPLVLLCPAWKRWGSATSVNPGTFILHSPADPESLKKMLEAVDRVSTRGQFGIGILLVIVTMYAVLFGILRAFRASPLAFVVVTLFFTVVALGQKLLCKGRQPGRASFIVGACFFVGLYIIYRIFGVEGHNHPFPPYDPVEGAFFGAIFGYPETLSLKTHVHLRALNQRPFTELELTDHPLAVEQRNGITMARVWEIVEPLLHRSRD